MASEIVIESLGGMCPVQGYGTINGEPFYFRYRYDDAQLYVGELDEQWGIPKDPPRLYAELSDVHNDPYRGFLDEVEAKDLLARLIGMLKPYAEWKNGTRHDQLKAYLDALSKVGEHQKE